MIVCESEIKEIERTVQKHVDDVEQLAKSNAEEKQDLKILLNQYNDKHAKQEQLQAKHASLDQEHEKVCVSKKQIVGLLHQKVKEKEEVCKTLEKQF